MKTFLKIFLVVLLTLLVLQALPIIGFPAGLGLAVLVGSLLVLFGCVGGLLAGALGMAAVVLSLLVLVVAVLSPLWLPLLLVLGLVALVRGGRVPRAQAASTPPALPPTA